MTTQTHRPRRLRENKVLREMLQETRLHASELVYPLFVKEGIVEKNFIPSMPGIFQWPLSQIADEAKDCFDKGVRSVILFGIPKKKNEKASEAYNANGVVQQAIKKIKEKVPELFVIADVCLCEYMSHGHCGVVSKNGGIENDPSLDLLAKTALSYAKAGVDMVAPSDMMDGRVAAIRALLDQNGFTHLPILSYAVKYASSFYGPFRDIAESPPQFGDRKTYQMDPANASEALREAFLDEKEGADILMVKPALPNLDILQRLKAKTNLPLAAYQVSGEYAMICAASEKGWVNKEDVAQESLLSIKRAGAQIIVTYFAKEIAQSLSK